MIQPSPVLMAQAALVIEPAIQEQFDDLIRACDQHIPGYDRDLLERAFRLAYWAHRNDKRASGEPYITHPLEVARIFVEEIPFDDISVAAALMHDVVEDTDINLEYMRRMFGDTMASIIDGLTKIRGVFSSRELGQAENVRKLMLSMATDMRVILVKFADRLHNMRTIDALPPAKKYKIATETRDLFAPLAHRFGLFRVKSELEDLSLKVLNPEEYREIVEGLHSSKQERDRLIAEFIEPLASRLKEEKLDFDIYGRSKNIHSIFRKMKRQEKTLDEIYDLMAVRIVLKTEGQAGKRDCWRAYAVVTDVYRTIPERFHDYLTTPKSNGYQSLHTTALGPSGRRFEVQIRTQEMHDVAERGVAAHWKYKEGLQRTSGKAKQFDAWLTWVRDLLETPRQELATEFVKDFRLNLYDDEIYVFTPKGKLVTLPLKATPVDFAFQVHTEVGLHCIGAKVNGKMVPLSYVLNSGDQVEIITSKKQTPNPDWAKFVVTHKARTKIKHWVDEKRAKAIELGREHWEKRAKKAGLDTDDDSNRKHAAKLKFPSMTDMFFELGSGLQDANKLVDQLKALLYAASQEEAGGVSERLQKQLAAFIDTTQTEGEPTLFIEGEKHSGVSVEYASCCNPLPGDEIFGLVSRTGSIRVHRTNCTNAPDLLLNHSDRIVSLEWSSSRKVSFVASLRIVGEDRVGVASDLTTIISKNLNTNIRSLSISSEDGIFDGRIVVHVHDLEHLRRVIERLRRVEGVHGVYRLEGS